MGGFFVCLLLLNLVELSLQAIAPLQDLGFSADRDLLLVFNVQFDLLVPLQRLCAQLLSRLLFHLALEVRNDRLQAHLQVEEEAGHHWRHIIKLVSFVFEVRVVDSILGFECLPLGKQFFLGLPTVHHLNAYLLPN